jgi:hypothetical protein
MMYTVCPFVVVESRVVRVFRNEVPTRTLDVARHLREREGTIGV